MRERGGEEGKGRGGSEGEKEGGGRRTGVSKVDISECPTQSLQQDFETQAFDMFPSYPLHVAVFTLTYWSNLNHHATSLRVLGELT